MEKKNRRLYKNIHETTTNPIPIHPIQSTMWRTRQCQSQPRGRTRRGAEEYIHTVGQWSFKSPSDQTIPPRSRLAWANCITPQPPYQPPQEPLPFTVSGGSRPSKTTTRPSTNSKTPFNRNKLDIALYPKLYHYIFAVSARQKRPERCTVTENRRNKAKKKRGCRRKTASHCIASSSAIKRSETKKNRLLYSSLFVVGI